jgi:hypothetical protein
MRTLTKSQKKVLTNLVDRDDIKSVNDISLENMSLLETLNDTEILWQECERFIDDYRMSKINN